MIHQLVPHADTANSVLNEKLSYDEESYGYDADSTGRRMLGGSAETEICATKLECPSNLTAEDVQTVYVRQCMACALGSNTTYLTEVKTLGIVSFVGFGWLNWMLMSFIMYVIGRKLANVFKYKEVRI
eukprot:SAG11_NODE_75_length_18024_cov_5.885356_12_plen_128_part_00